MLKKIVFLYLVLLVLFTGCNEEPTNIGINLLKDTILIDAITSDTADLLTGYEVFDQSSPMFNSGAYHIGKTDQMEAFTFIRFGQIPDSLEYLTEENIISCTMYMYPNQYAIGDYKNGSLSFKLQKIKSEWTNKTKYSEVNDNRDAYLESEKYNAWNGEIDIKDSMPPIQFDFPKNMMRDWFQKQYANSDTNNVMDTIWGVALMPDPESNVINRFNGLGQSEDGNYTYVETIYTNKDGETDTVNMTAAIEYSLFNDNNPTEGEIVIQGGISFRTRLDFDVSMLPDLSAIHKSELILHYNTEKSYWGSKGPDSTIALRLYAEIEPDDHTVSPILEWTADLSENTNQFIFESISSAVETWNRTPEKKGSVVLLAVPLEQEYRQLDRMVFYGNDAENQSFRPQIKIIYSHIEENSN